MTFDNYFPLLTIPTLAIFFVLASLARKFVLEDRFEAAGVCWIINILVLVLYAVAYVWFMLHLRP